MKEITLRESIGMDRGAMPKEFYRKLSMNLYDCQGEPFSILLEPNETAILRKCKNQPISWEGELKWDGRRISGVEKKYHWRDLKRLLMK